MKVAVLYFASLRETLGLGREQLDLPGSVATAADLRAHLCARGGVWAKALAEGAAVRLRLDGLGGLVRDLTAQGVAA